MRSAPGRRIGAADLLRVLAKGAERAAGLGLEVQAGHGIDYDTVVQVAALAPVKELNIGHFLIGDAIFVGLDAAIGRMRHLMDGARGEERP